VNRILIAWEDTYFQGLKPFVSRRLAQRTLALETPAPVVLHHTVRGNGRFPQYVQSTWTQARTHGLPSDPKPIDHLICVVDGDKLWELDPKQFEKPPEKPSEVASWYGRTTQAWHSRVQGWVDPSVPVDSVHGVVLRWSRESVVLAGYDQPPFREHLGLDPESAAAQKCLRDECPLPPATVKDDDFTNSFLRPLRCLERLFKAHGGVMPGKNDPRFDDTLRALANGHLDRVCARVPDLDIVVARVIAATAPAPAASTAPEPTPAVRQRPKRAKRG